MNMSHEQSRRNAARRRGWVAARHALAGHWSQRPVPVFGSGTVCYEVGANIERLRHDSAYLNAVGADLIPDPTTSA
jgi:hypothetical protein